MKEQKPFETLASYENAFLEIIEQLHYYLPFVASRNFDYYRQACQMNSQFFENLVKCYDTNGLKLYGAAINKNHCELSFRDILVSNDGLRYKTEIKRIFANFEKVSKWFINDYLTPMSQFWFGSTASFSAAYATMDKPMAQRCFVLMEYLSHVDMIYSRFRDYALVKRTPAIYAPSTLVLKVMACDVMFQMLERESLLKIETDLFDSILKTNIDVLVTQVCKGQTKHLTAHYKRLLHNVSIFKQLRSTKQISSKEFK